MTLKISFGTRIGSDDIISHNGYGYATRCMLESLQRLGYHVTDNDSTADVEIWFDQPHHWKFSKGPYKIGYHPWESTKLLDKGKYTNNMDWRAIMNDCDEIWTPSPIIAKWYKEDGITVPVHVYLHGVDHVWEPVQREIDGRFKFLHIGAESYRKRGWETRTYFRKAFQGRDDVSLTLKTNSPKEKNIRHLERLNTSKLILMDGKLEFAALQDLYYNHNAYIYPSYGEGFGLTPAQAIASGMPTITVPDWAPYANHLDPSLRLKAEMRASNWSIHPGKMFHPDEDDIIDKMRWVVDNYDEASAYAMSQAPKFHAEYDWDTITAKVFGDLESRLNA